MRPRSPRLARGAWVVLLALPSLAAGLAFAAGPSAPLTASTAVESEGRRIAGVTLDQSGQALAGVEVRVAALGVAPLRVLKVLSDENGRFSFPALAPGAYRLVAVKGGYAVMVGQLNTALQETLEIVLRPAGAPAAPGVKPEDNAWTLRLPRRDPLEDLGDGAPALLYPASRGDGPHFAPSSVTIEALASRVADAGDVQDGGGSRLALGGTLLAGADSTLSARLDHQDDGGGQTLRDRADRLFFRWNVGGAADDSVSLDLHQRASRLDATAEYGGAASRLDVSSLELTARRAEGDADSGRTMSAALALASFSPDGALQRRVGDPYGVARLSADVAWRRKLSDANQANFGASIEGTRGARRSFGGVETLSLAPASGVGDSLAAAFGDRAAAFADDTWQASSGLALVARARGEWARGFDERSRGAASIGARAALGESVSFAADAGAMVGGRSAGEAIYRAAFEGGRGAVRWTVVRSRESGVDLFGLAASPDAAPLGVLVGPDALVARWAVGLSVAPGVFLREVRLRGEWYDVEGDLAARLPIDLPLAPVAWDGKARGRRLEVGLALTAGTEISIAWDELEDLGGAAPLLEGARRWERRAVALRQRLARVGDTGAWYVIISAEDNDLSPAPAPAADDGLRLALLQRRRVSGGMALSF